VEIDTPTFWQSYRNGVGLALGIATVYVLILALLGWLINKNMEAAPAPAPEPTKGTSCSTSWAK
jgi:hypothetical protein